MEREGSLNFHVSGSIAMNDWAKDRVVDPEPLWRWQTNTVHRYLIQSEGNGGVTERP